MNLTPNTIAALKLIRSYTRGYFNVADLTGSSNATVRAHIFSTLAGTKIAKSNAGINALCDALYVATGATGNCLAARRSDFERIALHVTGGVAA